MAGQLDEDEKVLRTADVALRLHPRLLLHAALLAPLSHGEDPQPGEGEHHWTLGLD